MKSTSPEVSKSASLSSQHDEEVMDAFWDTLPKVDGTTGSTATGLAIEGRQEEGVQQQETIQERVNMDRKIEFPTEPYIAYPEEYLPSHPSSAKLHNPFKFLKDWIKEEEKKD
ncbi:hypothetical protein Dimus_016024 [Dionaea muscipula]